MEPNSIPSQQKIPQQKTPDMKSVKLNLSAFLLIALVLMAEAQQKKPNIVVIFGDDIGTWNVGVYTHGMMGRTPNIDRIAKERGPLH